ncbi:MAG: hypothetical protein AAB865_00695 [Patescibacteria group bacterium]
MRLSLALMLALAASTTPAFAEEPSSAATTPKPEIVSNFVLVTWSGTPTVRLILTAPDGASRLLSLDGYRQRDSWHFLVPEERTFASFSRVNVHPSNHTVTATVTMPDITAIVAADPATMQLPSGIEAVGATYYVNLDHGISCEGAGCAALPPAK